MKSLARHEGKEVAASGALEALVECLSSPASPQIVKENAACAIGHMARTSAEGARMVLDTGVMTQLLGFLKVGVANRAS